MQAYRADPAAIRHSDIYAGGIVHVKVGPEDDEKIFSVHKVLLMHYSGFFRGAFGSMNFQEGATGEIKLRDVEHDTFATLLDWLYTQKLEHISSWELYDDIYSDDQHITELYILADRCIVPALKSLVLEFAIWYYEVESNYPLYTSITVAFENLPEDDPYLQLLVDAHCLFGARPPRSDGTRATYIEKRSRLSFSFIYRAMEKYADISADALFGRGRFLDSSAYAYKIKTTDSGAPPKKKQKTTTT